MRRRSPLRLLGSAGSRGALVYRLEDLRVIGVGPQRTASTWLHQVLSLAGYTLPKDVKETFYFDRYYSRDSEWYLRHFPPVPESRLAEVGPTYFGTMAAAARISADCPEACVLVGIRDPAARAVSHYFHLLRYGLASGQFEDAISSANSILADSSYSFHLPRWASAVSATKVLLIDTTAIAADPSSVARQLLTALGARTERLNVPKGSVNPRVYGAGGLKARAGQHIADGFRSRGMASVVTRAKRLGLKPVFFGSSAVGGSIDLESIELVARRYLGDEVSYFHRVLAPTLAVNPVRWLNTVEVR